jgi:two-component system chemotaxis response regulator CheB
MTTTSPKRVLVADDSGLMRRVLSTSLTSGGFDVVGEAKDGDEALALWRERRPDVMTLDLAMPGMDGIGVLRALRKDAASVPVVVVSAFSPAHGARAVDALAEGAFDLVAKPAIGESMEAFSAALREKVGATAGAAAARSAVPGGTSETGAASPYGARLRSQAPSGTRVTKGRLILIASSTGGPRALAELLPGLPSPLGAGGLIVQHMPEGFTKSLAERLDRASTLSVAEAAGGESLRPDTLLIAPGGRHLRLGADRRTVLSDEDPVGALRPRADLTIDDAVAAYGRNVVLVVLTGMGKDGMDGAAKVKAAGGRVLAEAESSCTVYGMPRAVVDAGLADRVLPLDELPAAIAEEAWA